MDRGKHSPKFWSTLRTVLSVAAQLVHITLVYFNVDRYYWDADTAHSADAQSFYYYTLIVTIVYAACVAIMFFAWGATAWYCLSPATCSWKYPADGRMQWLEELGEYNAALSLGISPASLIAYGLLIAWGYIGTYPTPRLAAMMFLTVVSFALNAFPFIFFAKQDRALMSAEFNKSYGEV